MRQDYNSKEESMSIESRAGKWAGDKLGKKKGEERAEEQWDDKSWVGKVVTNKDRFKEEIVEETTDS